MILDIYSPYMMREQIEWMIDRGVAIDSNLVDIWA